MSTSPFGSCTWPAQKKSSGVGITWKVPLLGLYTADSNVPAANSSGSLPEPATNRTSPLYSTTEWMDLPGPFGARRAGGAVDAGRGHGRVDHRVVVGDQRALAVKRDAEGELVG